MRATPAIFPLALSLILGCTPDPPGDDDTAEGDDDDSVAGDDDDSAAPGDDDDSAGDDDDDDTTAPSIEVCHDGTGDHLTIQAALDAAPDGATVLICPGEYAEDLLLEGKGLTVASTDGAAATTVLGSGVGAVFTIGDADGVVLEGLTVTGGVAESGGGGVDVSDSRIEIRACTFTGNLGGFGGGLLANDCDLTVEDSEFLLNEAVHGGGGAYVEVSAGEITGCLFQENESELGGGLGVHDGAMEIRDNEFVGNDADASDTSAGGGGIWAYGDVDIICNTITANRSDRYAGGLFALGGAGDILGNLITDNSAGNDGGGVYLYTSEAWFSGNQLTYNTSSDDGGGMRARLSSALIEDNIISFNTATSEGGGGKLSHAANEFIGNILEGNVAGDEGGGIELDNDASTISDCTFLNNTGEYGGGLHSVDTVSELLIQTSTFHGNTASACGGALYIEDEPYEVTVTHVVATENTAAWGAGICVRWSDDTVVRNSVIHGNAATGGGGALYYEGSDGWLLQVSATGNSAPTGSGLFLTHTGDLQVTNTIVAHNLDGSGVYLSGDSPQSWTHNDVYGHAGGDYEGMTDPTGADGNLSEAPLFTDVANGDLHLLTGSPCIDSGNPALLDPDGTVSDMGAYGGPYGSWP